MKHLGKFVSTSTKKKKQIEKRVKKPLENRSGSVAMIEMAIVEMGMIETMRMENLPTGIYL